MKRVLDALFARGSHVCPWWCCFTFDNPVRRLLHDPLKILSPYIRPGFTTIDIGPGMGFFTVAMCTLVGKEGRVIAVDVQQKMLDALSRRVRRSNAADRLETRLCTRDHLGVRDRADFVLAFWMVHEVPHKEQFFGEVSSLLKQSGRFLMVEPYLHVSKDAFSRTVEMAVHAGLKKEVPPKIAFSRTALFSPSSGTARRTR